MASSIFNYKKNLQREIVANFQKMSQPLIVIIIPNYNGMSIFYEKRPILEVCLNSLKKTIYQKYKVILADDCSVDNSREFIQNNYPNVDFVKTNEKCGFAENNNNAIRYAIDKYNPKYILLLNNDIIIINEDWLIKLVEIAETNEEVGILGCKLVYPDRKIQHAGVIVDCCPVNKGRTEIDNGKYDKMEYVEAVTGALFLIKRRVIEKIGLFDEKFFMGYEDVDYCIRARNAGFKILYKGEVVAIHLEGVSSTNSLTEGDRNERFYMNQVGSIYFAFKHKGFIKLLATVIVAILGGMFTIENKDKVRKWSNLRVKNKPLWRLTVSLKAIMEGYGIYKNTIQRET